MSGIVDLHVSEYRPGGRMGEHRHDEAWFCLVVDGTYEESILGMRNEHGPGDLLFCPAGATHGQRFGSEGARKVIFHPDDTLAGLLAEHRARLDGRPLMHRSASLQAMGRRIVQALAIDDDHATLSAEALALDVLAETGRGLAELTVMEPGWLRRVREYLHEDPARDTTLADLATVAGRHPVHLARSFRLFHHCTPGDYLRRLRVERAAHLLRTTKRPLLDIALECGFAGAAQFSRSFRAVHATTPTAWRKAC
ncbi:AraC family transcriptional regulator [Luteibacter yeojuensis]|uniref:AraC family transcriptional regulator n=1 Tax=Luteibacter yeojuensis TaxID=345309 RepID=UPI0006989E51|nr:helix-turn-helix domain-containing protein [Luteibacter yeojuensis]